MTGRGWLAPREKGALSLDVAIAAMAFLAALALGASLLAERTAAGWRAGLSGRLTVQILPPEKSRVPLDRQIGAALTILRTTPDVAGATLISKQDTLALVRPWLGAGATVEDLPLPRLIDARLTPGADLDVQSLRRRLKAAAPDSTLDDHAHWLARLGALAKGVIWAAYGVLALIALATAAAVSFATRAGLAAHRDIVELLHRMGAKCGFIARAFEWRYCLSAAAAGAAGAALAALFYMAAGGFSVAGIRTAPFLPPLGLHPFELIWLAAIPVAAGLIALVTARLSVLGALRRIY